ncbi:MAG: SIS domain-containing protein [Acidimicrobiia bacterium]|nr:SIS domain-containing protein [Acidimicrobiia bacterium]
MSVESLYPFLYDGAGDAAAVREQAVRSTAHKAAEILELRKRVLASSAADLERCAASMAAAFAAGGRLFAFGNGGSSTDAQALVRLFTRPHGGQAVPAVCLTDDVAIVTALANDVGFDNVFARQVSAFARAGDVAVGVSTSGGSENVVRALDAARRLGAITVGLAGYDGGAMAGGTVDHLFVVPSDSVHRIQEAQTTLYHVLWTLTQEALASS